MIAVMTAPQIMSIRTIFKGHPSIVARLVRRMYDNKQELEKTRSHGTFKALLFNRRVNCKIAYGSCIYNIKAKDRRHEVKSISPSPFYYFDLCFFSQASANEIFFPISELFF